MCPITTQQQNTTR